MTSNSIKELWNRFKDKPGTTEYSGTTGLHEFTKALLNSVLVVSLFYGLLRFTDYVPGKSVRVHALFDSKEVFRSINDLRRVAMSVSSSVLTVEYIEAVIPKNSKALKRILENVGFVYIKGTKEPFYDGLSYVDGAIYRFFRED